MSYQQPYLIRKVAPDDIEMLIQLCAEHAAYEDARYSSQGKRERLSSALFSTPPRLYAWIVEQNGKLVGYATATQEFSTWDAAPFLHMDCLYLREETRGRGLGPLLIQQITHLAHTLGSESIQWQTPLWNERAISFYRRLGSEGRPKMRFTLPG